MFNQTFKTRMLTLKMRSHPKKRRPLQSLVKMDRSIHALSIHRISIFRRIRMRYLLKNMLSSSVINTSKINLLKTWEWRLSIKSKCYWQERIEDQPSWISSKTLINQSIFQRTTRKPLIHWREHSGLSKLNILRSSSMNTSTSHKG